MKKKFKDLKLGDVIQLRPNNAYSYSTIKTLDKKNKRIRLFRPYVQTADFSMSGPSVICYIGIEDFWFCAHPGEIFKVIREGGPLK